MIYPEEAIYIGDEFPHCVSRPITVRDDYSDKNNPCYSIKFLGESEWYDNMHDGDIMWV